MKALYLKSYGGNDCFVYGDLPDPVPGPGQVLIGVKAVSVKSGRLQDQERRSAYYYRFRISQITGSDYSGLSFRRAAMQGGF